MAKIKKILLLTACAALGCATLGGCSENNKVGTWFDQILCEHTYDEGEVVVEATCTTDGETKYVCTGCGKEKTEAIEAIGHEYVAYACKNCGEYDEKALSQNCIFEERDIAVAEGVAGNWYRFYADASAMSAPTAGFSVRKASSTNSSFYFVISPYSIGSTDIKFYVLQTYADVSNQEEWIEADVKTIQGDGYLDVHLPVNWEGRIQYTYVNNITYKDFTLTDDIVIAETSTYTPITIKRLVPLETASATHNVVADAAVAATCTTAGKTAGSHCSMCNKIIVPQEVIPATGHNYGNNGSCLTCGVDPYLFIENANYTEEEICINEKVAGSWYRFYADAELEVPPTAGIEVTNGTTKFVIVLKPYVSGSTDIKCYAHVGMSPIYNGDWEEIPTLTKYGDGYVDIYLPLNWEGRYHSNYNGEWSFVEFTLTEDFYISKTQTYTETSFPGITVKRLVEKTAE